MNSKEVAIAAYLGLKLKYPGLEIDKTGSLCVEIWDLFLTFVFRCSGGSQTGQERSLHAHVQGQEEKEVCFIDYFFKIETVNFNFQVFGNPGQI